MSFFLRAYNREITELKIVNSKKIPVYELKSKADAKKAIEEPEVQEGLKAPEDQEKQEKTITKAQMKSLNAELKRTGVTVEAIQDRCRINTLSDMSQSSYNKIMIALAKTKPKNVA